MIHMYAYSADRSDELSGQYVDPDYHLLTADYTSNYSEDETKPLLFHYTPQPAIDFITSTTSSTVAYDDASATCDYTYAQLQPL